MNLKIEYFAAMREQAGKSHELLETSAKTPKELLKELKSKYHFSLGEKELKVAINEEYSHFSSILQDGDTIVFIPPVAGG